MRITYINIKKYILLSLAALLLCVTCACDSSTRLSASTTELHSQIFLQTDHAEIIQQNGQYIYKIYGRNGEAIEQGESTRPPEITMDGQILYFSLQTGTGTGTRWGFFYDYENGTRSETFTGLYDTYGDLVAYGSDRCVIVQDIFDPAIYRQTFSDFSPPLADITEPILAAEFIQGGTAIDVLYFSGANLQEETQQFLLLE